MNVKTLSRTTSRAPLLIAVVSALAMPGLAQATAAYHLVGGEAGFSHHPGHVPSSRTRAEVQAEVAAARQNGTLAVMERGVFAAPRVAALPKTRAQVIAEVLNEPAEERRARMALLAGG